MKIVHAYGKYIPGEVPRFTTFMEALMGYCYAMRKKKFLGVNHALSKPILPFPQWSTFVRDSVFKVLIIGEGYKKMTKFPS